LEKMKACERREDGSLMNTSVKIIILRANREAIINKIKSNEILFIHKEINRRR